MDRVNRAHELAAEINMKLAWDEHVPESMVKEVKDLIAGTECKLLVIDGAYFRIESPEHIEARRIMIRAFEDRKKANRRAYFGTC